MQDGSSTLLFFPINERQLVKTQVVSFQSGLQHLQQFSCGILLVRCVLSITVVLAPNETVLDRFPFYKNSPRSEVWGSRLVLTSSDCIKLLKRKENIATKLC